MASIESKTYSTRLLHLISWSHWFTFFNIIIAIVLSAFYIFGETAPNSLIGHLYLYTTWTSHMGFLTFIGYVLFIFPIILIYPKSGFIRVFGSIIFTSGFTLLLLDAFIYNRLGYHLNASSSEQILLLITHLISHNTYKFWVITVSTMLLVLGIELMLSNYVWKHLKELQRIRFSQFILPSFIVAFFVSHFTHIWADASLDYEVLKQDTVLPLSYPATAKTLLTKYDFFDFDVYADNKENVYSLTQNKRNYPVISKQCEANKPLKNSVYLVLTESVHNEAEIKALSLKSKASSTNLTQHVDNALPKNAWFNLFYSLPSVYKNTILKQKVKPLLFQEIALRNIPSYLTLVLNNKPQPEEFWFKEWFVKQAQLNNVSSLIFNNQKDSFTEQLNNNEISLNVYYFDVDNTRQAALFIDALLLAQGEKQNKDIIFVSSIGNSTVEDSLSIKPSLFVLPNQHRKNLKRLTSHMDIQPTLIKEWLGCNDTSTVSIVNGQDIPSVRTNRVIANTFNTGIMVFNKDKSIYIDKEGNFESYSRQLQKPISVNTDFPLMIDGVNFIKRFTK